MGGEVTLRRADRGVSLAWMASGLAGIDFGVVATVPMAVPTRCMHHPMHISAVLVPDLVLEEWCLNFEFWMATLNLAMVFLEVQKAAG